MGLRTKILLLSAVVFAALALAGYFGLSATLLPAFDDLEDRSSRADVARVRNALESQRDSLRMLTSDVAQWDETYQYVLDPEYPIDSLEPSSLEILDSSLMIFFDRGGELHSTVFYDEEISSLRSVTAAEIGLNDDVADILTSHAADFSEVAGLIRGTAGTFLVASWPVLRTDSSGPPAGTFAMGMPMDDALVAELGRRFEVDVSLLPPDSSRVFAADSGIFGELVQETTDEIRISEQVLHDVLGEVVGILRITSTREITALGRNATMSALALFVGLGFVAIAIITLIIGGSIIQPIMQLRASLSKIEKGSEARRRVRLARSDEIGGLAKSIDNMLGRLEDMRQRNIEQSFKAGMAEVAAGLLHNVRNALMPAINNVSMAREAMILRSDRNVSLAIDEIGEPGTDAERREKLLKFLSTSHERSVQKRSEAVDYLANVLDQLDQAADAVRAQEAFANPKPVLERVKLGEVLDVAVGVIPADVLTGITIDIAREARGIRVSAHRVPLMQVIGSVLMNAVDSILETGSSLGRISIDARRIDGGGKVALTISDDGAGMNDDRLDRLFDRDFTTKEGVRGLGLHWSANALAGMGATISAASDGPGTGAEFRILLQATKPGTMTNG